MNSTVGATTLASPGASTADGKFYQAASESNNATAAISSALRFATAKSIRTSTIILASFNAFAAFITAVGIIYGCRQYKKRSQRRASESPASGLFYIHTVEVFPLILSLAITAQSITFAAAQSIGLQALLSRGCSIVSTFMLPAVFIVPSIHLVFGVETAIRAMRANFAPRGPWTVSVCLAVVGALTMGALIVAIVDRAPDFCFASLFWFVRYYAKGCFVVLVTIATITLAVMATIFWKLKKSPTISATERLTATRMTFYLVVGFISEVFVLPFFFSLAFLDQKKNFKNSINFSMIAAVVSNVNGLMVAGLHLFLRSRNTYARQDYGEYEPKEEMFSPRDRQDRRSSDHSLRTVGRSNSRRRSDSRQILLRPDDDGDEQGIPSPMSYGTARSPFSARLSIPSNPAFPEPTQPPSEASPSRIRKQSYSPDAEDPSVAAAFLPSTAYTPVATKKAPRDTYIPPPIVKPWTGRGHKRESSVGSTATVQIGIRFSNVDDYVPRKSSDTVAPTVPDVPSVQNLPVYRPSPLADIESRTDSSISHYSGDSFDMIVAPESLSIQDSRMKMLPPVPRSPAISVNTEHGADEPVQEVSPVSDAGEGPEFPEVQLITLSPTVYQDPVELRRTGSKNSTRSVRKLPSPKGVGFNSPIGLKSSDSRSAALPRPRPTGSAATSPVPSAKAAWI